MFEKDGLEYLFHYTSLDKLDLILKNHTIRLSPIANLDDPQEQKTKDVDNLGRFIFVSCWTEDMIESIPMWNLYTPINAGVRIGLPKNPFLRHGTKIEDFPGARIIDDTPQENQQLIAPDTFLNIAEMLKSGIYSQQAWSGDILKKIEYIDDIDLLEPEVLTFDEKQMHLDTGKLGLYKNTYWKFQNEWRYLMQIIPFSFGPNVEKMHSEFTKNANLMARGELKASISYYDLIIAPEMFEKMIITPSPKITSGNRDILELLVEKYNPKAEIKESELNGLV